MLSYFICTFIFHGHIYIFVQRDLFSQFCDMMLMTADKCTRLNRDQKSKEKGKTSNENRSSVGMYRSEKEQKDTSRHILDKDRKSKLKEEEKKSIPLDEKRPGLSKMKSKRLKDSFNNDGENGTLESNVAKVIKEPSDLNVSVYFVLIQHFVLVLLDIT